MPNTIDGILSLLRRLNKSTNLDVNRLKGWNQTKEKESILSLFKTYSFSDNTLCGPFILHILTLTHDTSIYVSATRLEKNNHHEIDVKIECRSDMLKTAKEIAANIDSALNTNNGPS